MNVSNMKAEIAPGPGTHVRLYFLYPGTGPVGYPHIEWFTATVLRAKRWALGTWVVYRPDDPRQGRIGFSILKPEHRRPFFGLQLIRELRSGAA